MESLVDDPMELIVPPEIAEAFAQAFALCLEKCSNKPQSFLFQYLIKKIHESSTLSVENWGWIASATNRTTDYLLRIARSVEDDVFWTFSRTPLAKRAKVVNTGAIEEFFLEKSKLSSDAGHRILDAHVGVDIKCHFLDWSNDDDHSVSETDLEKYRKRLHIWKPPHNVEDLYSCKLCRKGHLEFLETKFDSAEYKQSREAQNLELDIRDLKVHRIIVKAQFEYFRMKRKSLAAGEAIIIIDFSKEATAENRAILFAIVEISRSGEGKERLLYFLYGCDEKSKASWPFAQVALQHYFFSRAKGLFHRCDVFFDSAYCDFRNANMLLFWSLAQHYYGTRSPCWTPGPN